MKNSEFKRIKEKILTIDSKRWWGDDYDVRFYLVHQLHKINNKIILDVGGGIGIISSELNKNNFRINLDSSFDDLRKCKNLVDDQIETVCASMTHIPFVNDVIDHVICANILEIAKSFDINSGKMISDSSPSVELVLGESNRVMIKDGRLFITTPNNAYFQGNKMSYDELKYSLNKIFSNFTLWFYNLYPKLYKKNRKLNLANIVPKFLGKVINDESIFELMLKPDDGVEKNSVWFYVEAIKQNE